MEKKSMIKEYFNKKEMPKSMYYEAYLDESLKEEAQAFFSAIRAEKQYQDAFDYFVAQYKHTQLLEEYEGRAQTSQELRMSNQIRFIQTQLPIFASKLKSQEYYQAMKIFDKEYETLKEELGVLKEAFIKVLFLAAKHGLNEVQEKAFVLALANVDVDTTKEDLKEIPLFNVKNEKKYVGVKQERPKSDCPTYAMLQKQLPERILESIATTIKRMTKQAIIKRKKSDFTLEFNNQEISKLIDSYAETILQDYQQQTNRYLKECHSTMDVVNTYFDINGRSRAKYKSLSQDLEKFAIVKELPQGKEL